MSAGNSSLSPEEAQLRAQLLEMMIEPTARRGGVAPYWAISTAGAAANAAPAAKPAAPTATATLAVDPPAPPAHPRFYDDELAAADAGVARISGLTEFIP